MQMPHLKLKQEYSDEIKVIEATLKDVASGNGSEELFSYVQNKLDSLAQRFQYDEQIGADRYKLYELQALIYFFQNKDESALTFIEQAIEEKGSSYARAENLIRQIHSSQISNKSYSQPRVQQESLGRDEKRKKLIGIEGWLGWFVVGSFIAIGITLYNFLSGGIGLSSSDIDALNEYQSGLGGTFQILTTFENVAILIYLALLITSVVLIFRRSRLAKGFVIVGLVFGAVYSIIDYAVAYSIFESSGLTDYVQSEMSSTANYAWRNVITALIWVPYFLVSKRVHSTLNK